MPPDTGTSHFPILWSHLGHAMGSIAAVCRRGVAAGVEQTDRRRPPPGGWMCKNASLLDNAERCTRVGDECNMLHHNHLRLIPAWRQPPVECAPCNVSTPTVDRNSRRFAHHAEADVEDAAGTAVGQAEGRAAAVRPVVPGAAADDARAVGRGIVAAVVVA